MTAAPPAKRDKLFNLKLTEAERDWLHACAAAKSMGAAELVWRALEVYAIGSNLKPPPPR